MSRMALELRDSAVGRVGRNANDEWKIAARVAVIKAAAIYRDGFTTDDAEALLPDGVTTHEGRAWGAVMVDLARRGRIRKTGEYRVSKNPVCHARPKAVWVGGAS